MATPFDSLYYYKAEIVGGMEGVIDGDTFDMNIYLGFKAGLLKERIRLAHVNAYEIRKKASTTIKMKKLGLDHENYVELGYDALCYAKECLLFNDVIIRSVEFTQYKSRGSFGRILAHVFYEKCGKWINFGDDLVKKGFAYYDEKYKPKRKK